MARLQAVSAHVGDLEAMTLPASLLAHAGAKRRHRSPWCATWFRSSTLIRRIGWRRQLRDLAARCTVGNP